MDNKVKFQRRRLGYTKMLVSMALLFPMAAHAHLISITATTPFPATVTAGSSTIATFAVTNITSKVNVTVIDQSNFPGSLTISSSTCGNLLTPKQSCTIQVTLKATSAGQTISSALKEWAKPSADGVEYPINVTVTAGLPNITLVPVNSTGLPAVRDPVIGHSGGNWLLVSGSTGAFHDFNHDFIR